MKPARFAVPAAFAALLAMAQPALAKPVYLSCVTVENGQTEQFELTADEEAGTVSLFEPSSGGSRLMRAAFTRNQVSFSDGVIFDYWINRTDLSIVVQRINGSIAKGKCQLQPPPKRAF